MYVVRYEKLVQNPVLCLNRISEFWKLKYSNSDLTAAQEVCKRECMVKKIPKKKRSENKRVSTGSKKLSKKTKALFAKYLAEKIKDSFDYKLAPE